MHQTPTHDPASRRWRRSLVALNLVLAAAVGATFVVEATGQSGAPRGRGEYTMIGGEVQGGNANAIYVLDGSNQEMIALRWNDSRNRLEGIGFRDLDKDTQEKAPR